jgi:cell division protease FtsH
VNEKHLFFVCTAHNASFFVYCGKLGDFFLLFVCALIVFEGFFRNNKNMRKPKNVKRPVNPFGVLMIVAIVGVIGATYFGEDLQLLPDKTEEIALSELLEKYDAGELETVQVKETMLVAEAKDGTKFEAVKELSANVKDLGLDARDAKAKIEIVDSSTSKMWISILVGIVPFLLLIGLILFLSKRAGGVGGENGPFSFGKSKAKMFDKSKNKTKFDDIAGAEEAKAEVMEVVDFLKNPEKYHKMGAKIPRGILMVGPPGTGKTLMARAIAGEADAPFYSVSGSEFVEMFVGVGASRVRDLFKNAKKHAPAIIFIDEIDAIGKKRGNGSGGGHDEREQTLNQILTEMDGFEEGSNVIVIAATNRPDVLDNALLRPGRFDRRVSIELPEMKARKKILMVHAANKKLNKEVMINKIASKTVGFSGADLENIMNEAAISAVKHGKKSISQEHLEDAVEKVSMGPEKRSRKLNDKEQKIVAYHEVGHALAGHFAAECDPVHKISIISRGGALGVTWSLPVEDTFLKSEQRMKDEMVSLHGGRIAEELTFGEKTTGASNDLERITTIARMMVMTYGMGGDELGPVVFSERQQERGIIEFKENEYSPETARMIDEKVKELVLESESRCRTILKEKQKLLIEISEDLLKKENIYRKAFLEYLGETEEDVTEKTV